MTHEPSHPGADPLTDFRLKTLEAAVGRVEQHVAPLAGLEPAIKRLFDHLERHDARIRVLENEMPATKLVRGWVITAVISVVAAVGMAVVQVVVARPAAPPSMPAASQTEHVTARP